MWNPQRCLAVGGTFNFDFRHCRHYGSVDFRSFLFPNKNVIYYIIL